MCPKHIALKVLFALLLLLFLVHLFLILLSVVENSYELRDKKLFTFKKHKDLKNEDIYPRNGM